MRCRDLNWGLGEGVMMLGIKRFPVLGAFVNRTLVIFWDNAMVRGMGL